MSAKTAHRKKEIHGAEPCVPRDGKTLTGGVLLRLHIEIGRSGDARFCVYTFVECGYYYRIRQKRINGEGVVDTQDLAPHEGGMR